VVVVATVGQVGLVVETGGGGAVMLTLNGEIRDGFASRAIVQSAELTGLGKESVEATTCLIINFLWEVIFTLGSCAMSASGRRKLGDGTISHTARRGDHE
jgi:hypothetical protein